MPQILQFWIEIVTFHSNFQQAFLSIGWLNSDLEMNWKIRHPNAMLKTNRPTKMQQTEGGKPFGQISKCSKTNKPNRVYIPCAATHTELRSQRHPLKMINFLGRFMNEARYFQTLITWNPVPTHIVELILPIKLCRSTSQKGGSVGF